MFVVYRLVYSTYRSEQDHKPVVRTADWLGGWGGGGEGGLEALIWTPGQCRVGLLVRTRGLC